MKIENDFKMIFTIPIYSVYKVTLSQTLKSEIKKYPIFNSNLVPQYKVLVIAHQLRIHIHTETKCPRKSSQLCLLCFFSVSDWSPEIPECLWRDIFPFWVLLFCNHPGGLQLLASYLRLRGWGCWLSWCCCWRVDWLVHGPVIEIRYTVSATLR